MSDGAALTNVDIHGDAEAVLTPREERFAEEFIIDLSASRAAVRAGYSKRSARTIGSRLLQKPSVATHVEQLLSERSERTRITADRVLAELAAIAFSDLRDYSCNDGGQMRLTQGAPSSAARAVAAIKLKRTKIGKVAIEATVEFKLWDKVAALRLLAPHVGLVTDRAEVETMPVRFTLTLGDSTLLHRAEPFVHALRGEQEDPE